MVPTFPTDCLLYLGPSSARDPLSPVWGLIPLCCPDQTRGSLAGLQHVSRSLSLISLLCVGSQLGEESENTAAILYSGFYLGASALAWPGSVLCSTEGGDAGTSTSCSSPSQGMCYPTGP